MSVVLSMADWVKQKPNMHMHICKFTLFLYKGLPEQVNLKTSPIFWEFYAV